MTALIDAYPSRQGSRPSITPRKDPVVHATDPGRGPLSADKVERYAREGFLIFERFLDASALAVLRGEMDRLWDNADRADPAVIREPESDVIRSVFDVHRRSRIYDRMVRDPRIVAIIEQLLGGPVYAHQSRINYKRGFDGKEFFWHSDFETWHVEDGMPRMRAASVSIALFDNLPINGPLMLIPGSHLHYVACIGETPEDHFKYSLRRQEVGVPDIETLCHLVKEGDGIAAPAAPAGSLILFDCNTMHGSSGNMTPYPRSNLFVVYNSVKNTLDAPFGGTKPRPEFVAGRDFNPLVPA